MRSCKNPLLYLTENLRADWALWHIRVSIPAPLHGAQVAISAMDSTVYDVCINLSILIEKNSLPILRSKWSYCQ